jgi:hypothetical protein
MKRRSRMVETAVLMQTPLLQQINHVQYNKNVALLVPVNNSANFAAVNDDDSYNDGRLFDTTDDDESVEELVPVVVVAPEATNIFDTSESEGNDDDTMVDAAPVFASYATARSDKLYWGDNDSDRESYYDTPDDDDKSIDSDDKKKPAYNATFYVHAPDENEDDDEELSGLVGDHVNLEARWSTYSTDANKSGIVVLGRLRWKRHHLLFRRYQYMDQVSQSNLNIFHHRVHNKWSIHYMKRCRHLPIILRHRRNILQRRLVILQYHLPTILQRRRNILRYRHVLRIATAFTPLFALTTNSTIGPS